MAFNPLKEKGIPIEKQFRNWNELNVDPYDKDEVHPYTRTRIILMNGIEVEAAMFKHQFARNTDDYVLGQRLAQARRIEQQQQKIVNWLIPADESTLEVTLGYEQVAVDLTAWLARNELNPTVRDALDFALIEEQHVSHYESLADPRETWFERLLLHEYNECFLYYAYILDEPDERIKDIWQHQLDCEVAHVQLAADMLKQYESRDPESLLPSRFPTLVRFESNKDYVREILASQVDLTADGNMYKPVSALPDSARYFAYQRVANVDGSAPSQRVIRQHIDRHGRDYRLETEGPHPVERFRAREMAKA